MQRLQSTSRVPTWLKIVYTLFMIVFVPVYWTHYGPAQFLWGSDIALLLIFSAVIFESSLLVSMMTLAVLVPELFWAADFLARLFFGFDPANFSGTGYMFNPEVPLYMRGLSLYHLALPVLMIWLILRLGYDRKALIAQTLLCWVVFPVSYLVSEPERNINFIYGFGTEPQSWMPEPLYVLFLMFLYPAVLYLPLHLLLSRLFPKRVF